ncbi:MULTISPECIES: chaplin [Streptomyces]|uniref:chaplin n=1 Tax=Streptomyces TaxID=1883 RepID=UPI001F090780|nr:MULTISPECIES: chaplin [Streptomyces]
MTSILSLCSSSPVLADTRTSGAATDSAGVLSGDSVAAPVDVPVNACGDSVDAAAALNPAFGNSCAVEPSSGTHGTRGVPHGDDSGYGDDSGQEGGGGYGDNPGHEEGGGYGDNPGHEEGGGYGDHTPPPDDHHTPPPGGHHTPPPGGDHTPPPGDHTPPPGGDHTPPPGDHTPPPGGDHTPPPGGDHTPPPGDHTPPPGGDHTPPPGGEHTPPPGGHHMPPPQLPHTGAEAMLAASGASAAMIVGGVVLYRRGRAASRR